MSNDRQLFLIPMCVGERLEAGTTGAVNLLAAAVRDNRVDRELLTSWFSEKPDLPWINDEEHLSMIAEVKG